MKNLLRKLSHPSWDVVGILAGVSVYLAFLLPILGRDSAYFDEGYSSYLAHLGILDMAHYTALDVHPPLYYAVLHFWSMVVGTSVANLRLFSVVWGVAVIVLVFLMTRRWFGRLSAYLALGFIVLSPLFVRYSEAMRMYTMAAAICLAATYVLLWVTSTKLTVTRQRIAWAVYAVLVSAGMWTNYFTALVFATHLLWVVYEYRADKKGFAANWKWWRRAIIAAIVLYLPWLPWLLQRYLDVQATGFWIPPISINALVSTVTMALTFRDSSETTNWLVVTVIAIVASLLWLVPRVHQSFDGAKKRAFRLIVGLSIIPTLLLAIGSLPPLRSSYVYRYALFAVIMSAATMGIVIAWAPFKRHIGLKKTILAIVIFGTLTSGIVYAHASGSRSLDTGSEPMIGQAMDRIDQLSSGSEPIIARSPYTYYAAALYTSTKHPVYFIETPSLKAIGSTRPLYDRPFDGGIANLATFIQQHNKIWLVSEDKYSIGSLPATNWKKTNSFTLYDQQMGKATVYAAEYTHL